MASLIGRVVSRQILPASAGSQNPEDPIENVSGGCRRSSYRAVTWGWLEEGGDE
jgi:hypothetical protein